MGVFSIPPERVEFCIDESKEEEKREGSAESNTTSETQSKKRKLTASSFSLSGEEEA